MSQNLSKPVGFPAYRRSHFRSQTYLTLVRIFSHFPATANNGDDRIEQEEPEKGPEFSEFTGSASVNPEDHVLEKITQEVHETTERVGDKRRDSATNDVVLRNIEHMLGIEEVEDSLTRQWEKKSKQENNFEVMEYKIQNDEEKGDMEEGELAEDFEIDGECASMLKPANQDQGNSSISKEKVDVCEKKKHGPGLEERKAKKKQKKRKNQAEKDRQFGVKRLKLPSVQKPKTIAYCRHYLVGRCHEGDQCKFSHDILPLTKSTPCRHFARHSCMKGDDCPFDHELCKYPCNNFVIKGFCSRGDACLFSHQVPTKNDSPMPSKLCRPELKSPLQSRNQSFNVPPNRHGSFVNQNPFINSMENHSNISKDKVAGIAQEKLSQAPKGVSFINIGKPSLPSPSTLEQGMIKPNEESPLQGGACADQSAFGANQTLVEIPDQKLPAVAPKGANFLSRGEGSICGFGSSISFNGIKVPQFVNYGLPDNASSSLKKDDCSIAIDRTKQSVPKTDLVTHKICEKNQSVAEGIKSSFPREARIGATTGIQGCSYSHVDHIREFPQLRNHEHASNSGQRGLLSSLGFA